MSEDPVKLPDVLYEDDREIDLLTWTVIPALPGTRIEWKADWCEAGSVIVHAWLIKIDVIGHRYGHGHDLDMSCTNGYPMVLDSSGDLVPVPGIDLDGTPGEILEP
jgi:hypothetical protein